MLRRQIFWFALSGVAGFVVDAGVLYALLHAGLVFPAARVISFICAVTLTWLINRRVTFSSSQKNVFSEFARYFIAMLGGGSINYLISLAVVWIWHGELVPLLAVALGSIAGMSVNFASSRAWVFRR